MESNTSNKPRKVDFINTVTGMARTLFIITVTIFACRSMIHSKVNFKVLGYLFSGLFITNVINALNNIEQLSATFVSSVNYSNQAIFLAVITVIGIVITCTLICLLTHFTVTAQKNYQASHKKSDFYFVGVCFGLGLSAVKLLIANCIAPENNWQFSNISILSNQIPTLYALSLLPSYLINAMLVLGIVVLLQQSPSKNLPTIW